MHIILLCIVLFALAPAGAYSGAAVARACKSAQRAKAEAQFGDRFQAALRETLLPGGTAQSRLLCIVKRNFTTC
jgi:hypothetical protein